MVTLSYSPRILLLLCRLSDFILPDLSVCLNSDLLFSVHRDVGCPRLQDLRPASLHRFWRTGGRHVPSVADRLSGVGQVIVKGQLRRSEVRFEAGPSQDDDLVQVWSLCLHLRQVIWFCLELRPDPSTDEDVGHRSNYQLK